MTPALPVAHPNPTSYPLIEFVEQLQLRCQAEVTHPAADVRPQFAHPPFHRNAPATAGELTNAVFELLNVLLRHVDRPPTAAKDKAEPGYFLRKLATPSAATMRLFSWFTTKRS